MICREGLKHVQLGAANTIATQRLRRSVVAQYFLRCMEHIPSTTFRTIRDFRMISVQDFFLDTFTKAVGWMVWTICLKLCAGALLIRRVSRPFPHWQDRVVLCLFVLGQRRFLGFVFLSAALWWTQTDWQLAGSWCWDRN